MRWACVISMFAATLVVNGPAFAGGEAIVRPGLPALHAEPDVQRGGRIVDAQGREVLLRGVNVNAYAEYWKGTRFATTFPLAGRDPQRMASIGWNAVRLLLSWSRVEPRPGRYDDAYLDRIARAVDRLAGVGIYTILDLHQDAWGPTLAAGADEPCAPSMEPALGWDGAPGWATFDGGAPRCASGGVREVSPAVMAAWDAFFADRRAGDGTGIQTRYVEMLGHVAGRFAREPAVAGYDLMNEPNAFGADDEAALAEMYGRAITAIRRAERRAGGFPHLVFFEPSAIWSAIGRGAPPDFDRDENVVYSPHPYSGDPTTGDFVAVAREEARAFGGAPILFGEWGGDPDRAGPDGDGYFVEHQRRQDESQVGATLWTWRESCGDPHKVRDRRTGGEPEVWGEFEVDCADNSVTGVRDELVADLTRGYVRAAPGSLESTSYDDATGSLAAAGNAGDGDAGPLLAFHPGPRAVNVDARVVGLGRPDVESLAGGGVLIRAKPRNGAWQLEVGPR